MTTRPDPFSDRLGRLLDDAANGFDARPDVARLQRSLGTTGRRRGVLVMFSAAACLALLGGAAVAINGSDDNAGIAPAGSGEQSQPSAPKDQLVPTPTSESGEPGNDDGDEPIPPSDTEPKPTEPPPASEPKPTEPPRATDPPKATEPPTSTEKPAPPTTEKPAPPTTEKPPTTEPPTTDPPTTEPTWEWKANQAYGFCAEDPPYDVFWGTTAPGAKVRIESAYGNGTVYADEQGHWEITVYFPEAPLNEPFQVWVSSEGHVDDFWFKHKG